MAYRSTSPPQRQLYQAANQPSYTFPVSRATSANYATVTSLSNLAGTSVTGSTPAGTPSRRQNKRSSVTVVWPDSMPPASSSSRMSSAGGGGRSELESTYTSAAGAAANGVAGGAGGVNAPSGPATVTIFTLPKRPSTNSGPSAAAAVSATAGAARRIRTSNDYSTAASGHPSAAAAAATAVANAAAHNNNNVLSSGSRWVREPISLQDPMHIPPTVPPPFAPVRLASVGSQRASMPPWLHSPTFSIAEATTASDPRVTPKNAEIAVTASHITPTPTPPPTTTPKRPTLAAPSTAGVPLIPSQPQQASQQPLHHLQSFNTNGVCEDIVSGVRYAGGEAGLWGLTAHSNIPYTSPHQLSTANVALPSSAITPNASVMGNAATMRLPGVGGRRSSGRYTSPALPQYATSGDSALIFPEKRISNPFASYSTDLLVAELGQQGSAGGTITMSSHGANSCGVGGVGSGGDDLANTTDLIFYHQQQQQMQLHNQHTSTVLQRNTTACNDGLQALLDKAHQAYTQAEARLLDDGLSLIEDWIRTRDLFFSAGALFAAVGDTAASARCLLHATFINRAFHNEDEARTTLAMSVDQLKHAHPRVAVDALLRLAPCYAKRQLRYQTARCYRDAAEILETQLQEKERAVELYRVALEIYADTQVAAKALSRRWERQQRQDAQSTPSFANFESPQTTRERNRDDDNETSLSVSAPTQRPSDADATLMNLKAGLPPPHYQVSTTVQRSLVEACRGRLLVLLTELRRYPEVLEVSLTCAESVPRALPRTKYLLCATLSVLARGSPLPPTRTPESPTTANATAADAGLPVRSESGGVVALNAHSTSAGAAAPHAFLSATAEAADALYFESLYETERIFSVLQEEDRTYQRGKENELVRALLAANKACSLTMFDEAVRTYKGYTTTEPNVVQDLLLEQCRHCLFQHVERFA